MEQRKLNRRAWGAVLGAAAIGGAAAAGLTTNALMAETTVTPPPIVAQGGLPASFADVIEQVSPAVVNIQVSGTVESVSADGRMPPFPHGGPAEEFFKRFFGEDMKRFHRDRRFGARPDRMPHPSRGAGSGFIVDPDGYIVTNNHVIDGAEQITVTLQDGDAFEADVVGRDARTDLALIKIDAGELLPAVGFDEADSTRPGDWVITVGNPFGLGHTVTAGIVSARGRDINVGPYDDFLQIDAPINKGNSGGPAFNLYGKVVGVNAAIFSPSGGNVGIGFAIPASTARNVVADLRDDGTVERGWLGVHIQRVTEDLADGLGLDAPTGALVSDVTAGGPADAAGLRTGDVILSVDGRKIEEMRLLPRVIAGIEEGTDVDIAIWRGGASRTLSVQIGRLPERRQLAAAMPHTGADPSELGLGLAELDADTRRAFAVADGVDGVVVVDIDPDGRAAAKGVRPGDVIVRVDDAHVTSPADVAAKIADARRADRASVLVLIHRQDRQRFVALPLKDA